MSEYSEKKTYKRTLLQKYDIPVEFLDFGYIKECSDDKILEKIVIILRSGEEGHYPDLMKRAEEKLLLLKPESKLFRFEEPAIKKEALDHERRAEIDNGMKCWIKEMREQDQLLKEIKPGNTNEIPIRKIKSKGKSKGQMNGDCIKAFDYDKWDKYDADAEELKVDLDEERQRERVETINEKNIEKVKLIEVIEDVEVDGLSEFEKDKLSLMYKVKGNECVKVKEYDEAFKEYSQSIRIKPSAASFNNRAMINLKQKNYLKAIADCNECLKLDRDNVKAMIRKAQAFVELKSYNESYDTFEKVLEIDPNSQIAKYEIEDMKKKMPPRHAFRMQIEEIDESTPAIEEKVKRIGKSERLDINEDKSLPKIVQNIVVDEPTPFDKMIKEKPKREKLIMPEDTQMKKKNGPLIQEIN
ncbi:unnamed protein product [Diamesa hyperborea]